MFRYYWSRVSDHGKLLLQLRLPVAMSSACFEKLSTRRRRRRAWRHLPCHSLAGWRCQAAGSWKATMHQFAERKLVPTQASSQWRAARAPRRLSSTAMPLCHCVCSAFQSWEPYWVTEAEYSSRSLPYCTQLRCCLYSSQLTILAPSAAAAPPSMALNEAARTIAAPSPPLPPLQSRHCRHHHRCRRRLAKLAW